jgi:hypothetical protein
MACEQVKTEVRDDKDITWETFSPEPPAGDTMLAYDFHGNLIPFFSLVDFTHSTISNGLGVLFASGSKGMLQTFSSEAAEFLDLVDTSDLPTSSPAMSSLRSVDFLRMGLDLTRESFDCDRGFLEVLENDLAVYVLELGSLVWKQLWIPEGARYALDVGGPLDFLLVIEDGFIFYCIGYNDTGMSYRFQMRDSEQLNRYLNDFVWALENQDYIVVQNEILAGIQQPQRN